MNWDRYFLEMCKTSLLKSKDPSTKVGAVIVGPDREIRSTGWNGFPRGVRDLADRYNNREFKYQLVAHAEANAICNAAKVGTYLNNCTLYVYPLFVCNECAKLIIQVGIKEVVCFVTDQMHQVWKEKMGISTLMFEEAGVDYRIEYIE